jgi:tRNA(fMet)-specific endonuclease VapC
MAYLIDTNIWIFYLKRQATPVRAKLALHLPEEIFVCSIVWAELLHGACKYEDPALRNAKVETTLNPFVSLDFNTAAASHYATIRHDLEVRRCIIGANDLMIAAIALANDLTVVTNNVDEFRRVPGLRVEDWSV